MFAIIKTGGKQYKIKENDTIFVEKLKYKKGDKIDIKDVLLLSNDEKNIKIGTPILKGITIKAEVLEQKKNKKIIVFKKKRRKNYKKKNGHKQEITVLKILKIGSKSIEKKKKIIKKIYKLINIKKWHIKKQLEVQETVETLQVEDLV